MPTPCYISITGQTQGNITAGAFTADSVGNIYVQGHEDEMLVQEFLHNVTVPTDPQSGQPAGQRAHKPFIFTVALTTHWPPAKCCQPLNFTGGVPLWKANRSIISLPA